MSEFANSIQVGDPVVVVANDYAHPHGLDIPYHGIPGRVVSKSWPFLMVVTLGKVSQCDLRRVTVAKVSDHYLTTYETLIEKQAKAKVRRMEVENVWGPSTRPGHPQCPKCSGEMREQMSPHAPARFVCVDCDYEDPE